MARVSDCRHHTLYVYWTPGTTSNVVTVTVYVSSDDENVAEGSETWVQEQTWTLAGGHKTTTRYDLQETAGSTAQIKWYYNFDVCAKRVKITYSETVSAGVMTSHLLSHAT